ncbi:MAG: hypothetical protein ABW208_20620 [Pyrinomonadaceae bacterium]
MGTTITVALILLALLFLWRLFGGRAEVVNGTRVLVASLGRVAGGGLEDEDAAVYSEFYRRVKVLKALDADGLTDAVGSGDHDVLHLFCELDANGRLVAGDDSRLKGGELLEACRKGDVKVLFLAQDTPVEYYSLAFIDRDSPRGLGLNLVLTLDRKGGLFGRFLRGLLQKMSAGATMPMAWVALAPQIPNPPPGTQLEEQPVLIVRPDRGGVKLLP